MSVTPHYPLHMPSILCELHCVCPCAFIARVSAPLLSCQMFSHTCSFHDVARLSLPCVAFPLASVLYACQVRALSTPHADALKKKFCALCLYMSSRHRLYTYAYTCMHIFIHACFVRTSLLRCVSTYIVYLYLCIYTHIMYICTTFYTYIHVNVYICLHAYILVYQNNRICCVGSGLV